MIMSIRWNEIQGIVFDAVGTLIEPSPSVAMVYAQAAARQGIDVELHDVKDRFHRYFRNDEIDDLRGPLATDEILERRRWRRIVSNVLPDLPDADRGFEELWEHFGSPSSWRLFDDVANAMELLEGAGFPIRIASNFDRRLRGVVAGLPQLDGRVHPLVISSEVGYRKPHPRFYEASCESLGLPPSRVLYIGDDAENDVRGPRRAGLAGLLLDRDSRHPDDIPYVPNLHVLIDYLIGSGVAVQS